MPMKKAELLSPAGDMEKLKYAIHYGADAVYLAGREFGMRTASKNFDETALSGAVSYAHARGVQVYVTLNTLPREDELSRLPAFIESVAKAGADAVIVSDAGVLSLVLKHAPGLSIHISTQANTRNHLSAAAWYEMGASRVVLARELSLSEIAQISEKCPRGLELEVFVHGAMCMSHSGRCLLSNYMAGRDANRGNCAQPCRWKYHLVEELRPGQYMPICEDKDGSYILNAKDLCMIEHIPELLRSGIASLKIEGRVKTEYYAAVITGAYRRAIDIYYADLAGFLLPREIYEEVHKVSHRPYSTGFYFGDPQNGQSIESADYIRDWEVCAAVRACDEHGNAVLEQRNKFAVGEEIELVDREGVRARFAFSEMRGEEGNEIPDAPHPRMKVHAKLPCVVSDMAFLRTQKKTGNE